MSKDLKSAKAKARVAFKEYIRYRDAWETSGNPFECVCCTCGKLTPLDGSLHGGHFIQGSTNSTYFEETNCHGQCNFCNLFRHGALDKYLMFMIKKYGQDEVDRLYRLKGTTRKFTVEELDEITKKYRKKLDELS